MGILNLYRNYWSLQIDPTIAERLFKGCVANSLYSCFQILEGLLRTLDIWTRNPCSERRLRARFYNARNLNDAAF